MGVQASALLRCVQDRSVDSRYVRLSDLALREAEAHLGEELLHAQLAERPPRLPRQTNII